VREALPLISTPVRAVFRYLRAGCRSHQWPHRPRHSRQCSGFVHGVLVRRRRSRGSSPAVTLAELASQRGDFVVRTWAQPWLGHALAPPLPRHPLDDRARARWQRALATSGAMAVKKGHGAGAGRGIHFGPNCPDATRGLPTEAAIRSPRPRGHGITGEPAQEGRSS
jgi:hypothetical protein